VIIACVGSLITGAFVWRSRVAPDLEWTDPTQLPPTREAPAFVSSEAPPGSEYYIEPLIARGHARFVLEKLAQIMDNDRSYRNVRLGQLQLQAVAVTPTLGFEDDLVFQVRTDPERVEVWSGSRVGVGDFGTNRERIEELRAQLQELILVK